MTLVYAKISLWTFRVQLKHCLAVFERFQILFLSYVGIRTTRVYTSAVVRNVRVLEKLQRFSEQFNRKL